MSDVGARRPAEVDACVKSGARVIARLRRRDREW